MQRAARMRAPEQQPAGVEVERLLELGQQPALAEAGLADDGERARPALDAGRGEGRADHLELGFAADHRRVHALDAAARDAERARLGALDQVAAQRLVDALDLDERRLAELEQPAHVAIGVVADAQPPGGALCSMRAATLTVAPRMLPSASTPPPSSTVPVCMPARTSKSGRPWRRRTSSAAPCASSMIASPARTALSTSSSLRCLGAEGGEHAVAGVLQHPAVVRLHDRGEALERAVHHRVDLLGLEMLAHRRGADDVDEQHRHLLELLAHRRPLRALRGQLAPQRRERRVDDGIAERRPLRFERSDGGGELYLPSRSRVFPGCPARFGSVRSGVAGRPTSGVVIDCRPIARARSPFHR